MDRTIQDLKDENQMLRDGIRIITGHLKDSQYVGLSVADPDLLALNNAVSNLVTEHGHAVRQSQLSDMAMEAWEKRAEQEEKRGNELAAIIRRAQALADEDRVDHPVYGEDVSEMVSPGWRSKMGRDLHAVLKKGMQALVDHYDSVHRRAWDNGYLNGREDTLSEVAQQANEVPAASPAQIRANHWYEVRQLVQLRANEASQNRQGITYRCIAALADEIGNEARKIARGEA